MFEGESNRVHRFVAAAAHGIRAVLLHAIADGALDGAIFAIKSLNPWRRRRRRRAQELLEHPLATLDR